MYLLCTFETKFSMQASLSSIMGILLWCARAILETNIFLSSPRATLDAPNWPSMHVRPSTNTSFPTCPCYTLSEYVRHPGKYFNDSNLTLQFLPGNQTLDVNVTKTSIHQLELLGNSSAAVTTTVACSSKVGLSFRHISKVRIDCLAFVCVPDHARFTLVMIMTQPMQAVPKIWVYHLLIAISL